MRKKVVSAFCFLAKKNISARHCLSIQSPRQCFGCASPFRLCHACRAQPVAFPEVDYCPWCLPKELDREKNQTIPEFPVHTKVSCLLVKKKISVATCRKIQSQACGVCPAPTRICLKCKKKPIRYLDYGLCLACTVENFKPDWQSPVSLPPPLEGLFTAFISGPSILSSHINHVQPKKKKTTSSRLLDSTTRLRLYRKMLGKSQNDLAHFLGQKNVSNISRWEHGHRIPGITTALKIAKFLEIPVENLFEESHGSVAGPQAPETRLSIFLGNRSLAMVVMQEKRLIALAIRDTPSKKSPSYFKKPRQIINKELAIWQPTSVAIGLPLHYTQSAMKLLRHLQSHIKKGGISVEILSPKVIRQYFLTHEYPSHQADLKMAGVISTRFPRLKPYYGKLLKMAVKPRRYHLNAFLAIAQVLFCLEHSREKLKPVFNQ